MESDSEDEQIVQTKKFDYFVYDDEEEDEAKAIEMKIAGDYAD